MRYFNKNIFLKVIGYTALYICLYFFMNPSLLFHCRERPFLLDAHFFSRFARHVGGIIEYGGSFLVYTYSIPWFGTITLTALFLCHYYTTKSLFCLFRFPENRLAALFFTWATVIGLRYYFTIVSLLSLLLGLLVSLFYFRLTSVLKKSPIHFFIFLFFDISLAYITAGGATVFLFLIILHSYFLQKNLKESVLFAVSGIITPLFIYLLLPEPSLLPFFFRWIPMDKAILKMPPDIIIFYSIYSIVFVSAALMYNRINNFIITKWRIILYPSIALVAVVITIITSARHYTTDKIMEADMWMEQHQWEESLYIIQKINNNSELTRHIAIRCLCQSNRLLNEIFCFPQIYGADIILLSDPEMDSMLRIARKRADIYYELGMINEAERWTHEAFTDQGEISFILRRLFYINVIKKRLSAAMIFLNALSKNPWIKPIFIQDMDSLQNNFLLSSNDEITRIRNLLFKTDYVGPWTSNEILTHCITENPSDRITYDYLIADCLLNKRMDVFAKWIAKYKEFHAEMPHACEEACIAYLYRNGTLPEGLGNWKPSFFMLSRFNDFLRIFQANSKYPAKAWKALSPSFGNTFWFYDLFGRTAAGSSSPAEE
mgnify:CR=1 FL=1